MSPVEKKVIGLLERVKIIGKKKSIIKKAIVDTGATRTCVDMKLAARAGLGPVVSTVRVKSKKKHGGNELRAVVKGIIEVKGIRIPLEMSLEDRGGVHHKILLGRDALHGKFIVDIEKTHNSNRIKDVNE